MRPETIPLRSVRPTSALRARLAAPRHACHSGALKVHQPSPWPGWVISGVGGTGGNNTEVVYRIVELSVRRSDGVMASSATL